MILNSVDTTATNEEIKKALATIFAGIIFYSTDLSKYTDQQLPTVTDNIVRLSCNIVDRFDNEFKSRGWTPPAA